MILLRRGRRCHPRHRGLRPALHRLRGEGFENARSSSPRSKSACQRLIILDVMLPGEDGLEILKRIRFSAPHAQRARHNGHRARRGVRQDNGPRLRRGPTISVKPFGMMEWSPACAPCSGALGGTGPAREAARSQLGPLTLDTAAHTVSVGGRGVTLTLKEWARAPADHDGEARRRIHPRPPPEARSGGTDYDGETRTVDVHIRTLRQKLGEAGGLIGTVRGVGYRMEAQP